jgi:hypothetical protein
MNQYYVQEASSVCGFREGKILNARTDIMSHRTELEEVFEICVMN